MTKNTIIKTRKNTIKHLTVNVAKLALLFFLTAATLVSCRISYSFTGASISPDVKTFSIGEFVSRASNANPTYAEFLVEELRRRFVRQTSLNYSDTTPDLEFEGAITGYEVRPMSMRDSEQEAMNRLTITIQVKFTNNKNHDQDFDSSFSAFSDFSSESNLSDVEDQLMKVITEELIDQIFNKSVANW